MKNTQRKQLKIFLAVAFAFNFLMAIPLYIAKQKGLNLDVYPLLMMLMPAAGVMLAALVTRKDDPNLPKAFFIFQLVEFAIIFVLSLIPLFTGASTIGETNIVIVIFSFVSWIMLFINRKKKNKAYGMDLPKFGSFLLITILFLVLYFGRALLANYIETGDWVLFKTFTDFHKLYAAVLIPNFFLSFTPFFGEEYGWRYFFQPILQKKFGMIKGIFVLGLIWGIWHAPLNFFYYSSDGSGLQSLIGQIGTCISLSLFFAFAYYKTKTVWAPVFLHYLNNNLILLFAEDPLQMNNVIQGNEYTWATVAGLWIAGFIFFGFVVFLKSMKDIENQIPTMNERADSFIRSLEELEVVNNEQV